MSPLSPITLTPIGVIHSPFVEKRQAPRQATLAAEWSGSLELFAAPGIDQALRDIETWSHLWILFVFHKNQDWVPLVQPPRGQRRRGVFATRSPHRPNSLGLSAVKLERREGLVLQLSALDILDGSPVLDIKPYVPYSDAFPDANHGWLDDTATPSFDVCFSPLAEAQLTLLDSSVTPKLEPPSVASPAHNFNPDPLQPGGVCWRAQFVQLLAAGPEQPKYRRIQRSGEQYRAAIKAWRAYFTVEGTTIRVSHIASGYRAEVLASSPEPELAIHRQLEAFTLEQQHLLRDAKVEVKAD